MEKLLLSELEPLEARLTGYFDAAESSRGREKTANVLGRAIAGAGTEHPKGWKRQQSRIVYNVGGRDSRFEGRTAALDDLAGGKGSVRFVVEKDGAAHFEERADHGG